WYEQKLWHMYDCTDYAGNLFNLPTIAYSGEKDSQKQAADMMAKAMAKEGMFLTHIIGPNTEHRYHPEAKQEINRRIDAIADLGRDPVPRRVRFTTWTLRYDRSFWVVVEGMGAQWKRADIDAKIIDAKSVGVKVRNVTRFALEMGPGRCPLDNDGMVTLWVFP